MYIFFSIYIYIYTGTVTQLTPNRRDWPQIMSKSNSCSKLSNIECCRDWTHPVTHLLLLQLTFLCCSCLWEIRRRGQSGECRKRHDSLKGRWLSLFSDLLLSRFVLFWVVSWVVFDWIAEHDVNSCWLKFAFPVLDTISSENLEKSNLLSYTFGHQKNDVVNRLLLTSVVWY